jgi:2-dehydropantoate 2-reductase
LRILVAGTGALACTYAAYLARTGDHDVILCGHWKEQVETIAAAGITITDDEGSERVAVEVCEDPNQLEGAFDLVIAATKSYHLAQRILDIRQIIGEDTAIFGVQNGLTPWETLVESLDGAGIALAGESMVGATKIGLGAVRVHFLGETLIAPVDPLHSPVAERTSRILETSGMPARALPAEQLTSLLWEKAILACGISALSVLLQVPVSGIHRSDSASALALRAMAEVQAVAATLGITLDARAAFAGSAAFGKNRPSTLEDFLAGRPSEIPDMNGALVERARANGLEAPVNEMLHQLVLALYESAPERINEPQNGQEQAAPARRM